MTAPTRDAVVTAILAAHQAWGHGPPVAGEWGAIREEVREPIFDALDAGHRDALAAMLFAPSGRYEWTGLYSTSADIQADLALWQGMVGPVPVTSLVCSDRGEIYNDTPRHDATAAAVLAHRPRVVLDIGGGYGGLAWRLVARDPSVRVYDLDLVDTLYIAYAFLAPRLPAGMVTLGYDPDARICLLPTHVPGHLPAPDVVTNCRSWSEMPKAVVADYFARIATEWRPAHVVHENANWPPSPHESDAAAAKWPELLLDDFPPLPGYTASRPVAAPWTAGRGRYATQTYTRMLP